MFERLVCSQLLEIYARDEFTRAGFELFASREVEHAIRRCAALLRVEFARGTKPREHIGEIIVRTAKPN